MISKQENVNEIYTWAHCEPGKQTKAIPSYMVLRNYYKTLMFH